MLPLTDPILVFTVLLLAILFAPMLSGRLRIPDLVLLLGFGALLGPKGFHVLEHSTAVTVLGAVGMIYIMFLAGLEIDLYRFKLSYKRSLAFGLMTFIIPQALGTFAVRQLLGMTWPASLLLASMFASHTLLAYPLASRLGISRSEPVAITVGATIITDILALMVLAIVADSAKGIPLTSTFWITIILGIIALTALTWYGVPVASRWFFQRISEEGNAQFIFVLSTVCICAYLSHFAKMEPIIGAFLAGAAFNRLIPEHCPLMNRITFAGNTLFIPFFLISVGMLVDPNALLTGSRGWQVGILMVCLVVISKYVAAHLTRWLFGYSSSAGQVMFGLSVVQAAATLAAVVVGYNLKILDECALNGAIMMILVTCPLGSWVVERFGRQMAAAAPARSATTGSEQRILLSVAEPESSTRLLDLAFQLRSNRPGGIFPLTIARDLGNSDEAIRLGEKHLGHCLAHAAAADIPVTPGLRVAMNTSDGLIQAAKELRSSQIVVDWAAGPAASSRIFGTLQSHLIDKCPPRLLLCRLTSPLNTIRRIILPLHPLVTRRRDFQTMLGDCKRLASRIGAELCPFIISSESKNLLPTLEKTKPACPIRSTTEATWQELITRTTAELNTGDMLIMPSDRRSGIMWTPALERLPEQLAKDFPALNLLLDFPSLPHFKEETVPSTPENSRTQPLLLPVDISEDHPLQQALETLVLAAFPDNPNDRQTAISCLQDSMLSFPVELKPGIVLLHARCGTLTQPHLLLCHAKYGWTFPDLSTPAHLIMVLLGGKNLPAEQHLSTLSTIVKRVLKAEGQKEFQNARCAEEICDQF